MTTVTTRTYEVIYEASDATNAADALTTTEEKLKEDLLGKGMDFDIQSITLTNENPFQVEYTVQVWENQNPELSDYTLEEFHEAGFTRSLNDAETVF